MKYCKLCLSFIKGSCIHEDIQGSSVKLNLDHIPIKKSVEYSEPVLEVCSFCNEKSVKVEIKQIRGLDEAPTTFYYCYSCKKTKKEE